VTPRGAAAGLVAALGLAVAVAQAQGPLGADGTRAFQMARTADDAAVAARDEGDRHLAQVERLAADNPRAEALEPIRAEAAAAREALDGYRRQAQVSASEALGLLADLARGTGPATGTSRDPMRREVVQQRALLAAHEAAVMAARARAEAERLRALAAEARVALAGGRAARPAPPGAERPRAPQAGEVQVPNLVGARLPAATQDLAAVGLRLGAATGPADGFVVKQDPEAGAVALRATAVAVTLSATAAGVSPGQ
jgi:hypothetical protein